VAEQVVQEMHPATPPGAALEHALDRCRQPPMWASEITSRVPFRPRSYCFAETFG
jgi:hypothetical protein